MKLKIFLLMIFIAGLVSSCIYRDPAEGADKYNYKGDWIGRLEPIASNTKPEIKIKIISQGEYGNITGTWTAFFSDGDSSGILRGSTRKGGINIGLEIAKTDCQLSFEGNREANTISGVYSSYPKDKCAAVNFDSGSLSLSKAK